MMHCSTKMQKGWSPVHLNYLESLPSFKYLGLLRVELAGLGIERNAEVLEDHAGFLCEIMCLLIEAEDPRQIGFFSRHLKSWLPLFSMI